MRKILILQPGVYLKENIGRVALWIPGQIQSITIGRSQNAFFENLNLPIKWDMVLIDFENDYFFEMKNERLGVFARKLKEHITKVDMFVGISSHDYQRKQLLDLSIPVRGINFSDISRIVLDHYGFSYVDFLKRRGGKEIEEARHIIIYFTKLFTKKSFVEIGAEFGRRDHTSIMHSFNTVKDLIDTVPEYAMEIHCVFKKLLSAA